MCFKKINQYMVFPTLEQFDDLKKLNENNKKIFLDYYFKVVPSVYNTIIWASIFVLFSAFSLFFSSYEVRRDIGLIFLLVIEIIIVVLLIMTFYVLNKGLVTDLKKSMKLLLESQKQKTHHSHQ